MHQADQLLQCLKPPVIFSTCCKARPTNSPWHTRPSYDLKMISALTLKIPICSNATVRRTLGEVQQLGSNPVDAFLPWKALSPHPQSTQLS